MRGISPRSQQPHSTQPPAGAGTATLFSSTKIAASANAAHGRGDSVSDSVSPSHLAVLRDGPSCPALVRQGVGAFLRAPAAHRAISTAAQSVGGAAPKPALPQNTQPVHRRMALPPSSLPVAPP